MSNTAKKNNVTRMVKLSDKSAGWLDNMAKGHGMELTTEIDFSIFMNIAFSSFLEAHGLNQAYLNHLAKSQFLITIAKEFGIHKITQTDLPLQ